MFKHLHRVIAITFIFINSFLYVSAQKGFYSIKKVVIDAGHGGKDPGAVGRISYEKNVVLPISLQLGRLIKQNYPEIEVIYTRKKDVFVPLDKRADIANKNQADLFISIHANSNPDALHTGCETYAMGLHTSEKNLEVAKRENSVIVLEEDYKTKYESFEPKSAESYIIFSLMQNSYLEQSLTFAAKVQEQFSKYTGRIDRGVKQAGFVVLWHTTMPSVLIETGFLSNREEEIYLNSTAGQNAYALSIYKAFAEYELFSRKTKTPDFNLFSGIDVVKKNADKSTTTKNDQNHKNQTKEDVHYEVQISSSANKLSVNSSLLKGVGRYKITKIGKSYKYTVGYSKSFKEIVAFQDELRKKIPTAFVVAFKNGKKISLKEAKQITEKR